MSSHQDQSVSSGIGAIIGILVLLAIVVAVFVKSLIGHVASVSSGPEVESPAAVEERIRPIGQVTAGDVAQAAAAPAAPRSGKEVFDAVCTACHSTGAAGAPKAGDKAAWAPRIEQGFDTLLSHAINGFKGMPARGGNPSVSDEEMKNAVGYLLEQVGAKAPAGGAAKPASKAEAAPAAGGEADLAKGQQVYQAACFACHGTGAAGAPLLGDKAAWGPRIAQGMDTLLTHATNGFKGMPPKGGRMDLSDGDVKDAIAYMVDQAK